MYTYTNFLSKRDAEAIGKHDRSSETILISLNSPVAVTPMSSQPNLVLEAWSAILSLEFHDADPFGQSIDGRIQSILEEGKLRLFSIDDAHAILRFLKTHEGDHTRVIVHCEGGISRSAAVAKFISEIYELDFPNGYSLYNRYVFSTLYREYMTCFHGNGAFKVEELPGTILK